ncbi:MAG TPA: hypothetical protein VEH31_19430 [Streptosporangiaceae bacterium]|nr:hypothetical protein [Streptosporangiaceae bacterium]
MSADRGKRLQRAAAAYLAAWWPHAESNPNGRTGADILGTPGVAWEIKTPRLFRPAEWARQAARNAGPDLPVILYFPDGFGARSAGDTLAILPTSRLMAVLEEAGYAPGPVFIPRLEGLEEEAG